MGDGEESEEREEEETGSGDSGGAGEVIVRVMLWRVVLGGQIRFPKRAGPAPGDLWILGETSG